MCGRPFPGEGGIEGGRLFNVNGLMVGEGLVRELIFKQCLVHVQESVDRSLQRLGTDHIDLLQIHWPDREY